MARETRVLRVLSAGWLALLSTQHAAAQQVPDAPTETAAPADAVDRAASERRAVRLGHDALALYEASRWDEAHDRFQAAEQLVHSPVFRLYMARCRRNAGKLLEAAKGFDRVSRERIADNAPSAWHGAIADAAAELMALRRAIPRVIVVVRGTPHARVSLDGRELAHSALGKSLDLDPGPHSIVARDSQGRERTLTFRLTESEATRMVEVSFDAPEAPRDSSTSATATVPVLRTAGFVLLGVGAAGLGFGIGTAIVATGRGDEDRENWTAMSTASLIAGGAVAGAGVLLLLLHPRAADTPAKRARR